MSKTFGGAYLQIKYIIDKNLDLLQPFSFNKETLLNDIKKFLSVNHNKSFPVVNKAGEFLGATSACLLNESLKSGENIKFLKVPVLNSEDDLVTCKSIADDDYLNENSYIYITDKSGFLVGFISCQFIRIIKSESVLYMFLQAIDHIDDGIVIVDKNSKIIYVNEAYSKILNVNRYKVLNKFVDEIEPGAIILDSLKEKKSKVNTFIKVKSRGKTIIANINPIIIRDELFGAVSIFKDITEVCLLNKELKEVRKLTGYLYNDSTKFEVNLPESFSNIIGKDKKFVNCLKLAAIVAPTDATVLIEGESGVGKEVVVNAILEDSARSKNPFVNINCSAIPESLFESELFGYADGSFTGAQKGGKMGKFEIANNGTIFLDEIGEMPLFMQAKLLRVLQSGEIQKIGSNTTNKVNVRVIAATNKNLKSMVDKEKFREDLYFRLNTFKITIPPLRDRGMDIILLAEFSLKLYCDKYNKNLKLSDEVKNILLNYEWYGNVRQLQSCIEYSVIICQEGTIEIGHLPDEIKNNIVVEEKTDQLGKREGLEKNDFVKNKESLKNIIADVEKMKIINVLKKTNGNRTRAIKELEMCRRTFYRKLRTYGINPNVYTK